MLTTPSEPLSRLSAAASEAGHNPRVICLHHVCHEPQYGDLREVRRWLARVARERHATRTSGFGVGKRENHDSSDFYSRFSSPTLSDDEEVVSCDAADTLFIGDSRDMSVVPSESVSLVATSPPYHASKHYETEVNAGHVPASYVDYLEMLHGVFTECFRVLEPGGRIAVNVANLGRKPFRSLSKDVWVVLEAIGFLPRGEIVWTKAAGASGNCAWGSWMSASNPSLRDLTERVLVASKGRFDR